MFAPSLTLLLCLMAPLIALLPLNKGSIMRGYALASAPLFLAAALAAGGLYNTSVLTLDTGSVSEATLPALVPFAGGALLVLSALVLRLQMARDALFYPRLARALCAPLSLAAASAVPLVYASVYLLGVVKWEFAATPVKALGIAGLIGGAVSALALLAFLGQLVLSIVHALRGKMSAP